VAYHRRVVSRLSGAASAASAAKGQCSAEEYEGHARAIAGAIDGVNTALIDRALAAQPELEDRIEAELAEFGRIR
jgi:hypothetical protein